MPRRWLAGGDLEGRPALGASGGREEGRGALDFGIVGAEGGVPRRAELGGHGDGAALATLGDEDLAVELQGEVGRRFPRLFWAGRGRNDELDGELRTAAMLCRGGGVPEALGGGERAWEDQ